MPFTPFHFGPGSLIKSLLRKHFSFSIFIISQIIIDLETLKNILSGSARLHTFFHTFLGVTLLIPLLAIVGKYLFQILASKFSKVGKVSWSMSFISSAIGFYSHILLDAVMHRDLMPFAPFSTSNPFLGLISVSVLYHFCLLTGFASFIVFIFSKYIKFSRR